MSKQKMTIIDPEKLRAFVEANDPAQVEAALGKSRYYFKNVYARGEMPSNVLTALCKLYDIDPSEVTPGAPEQQTEFCQFEIKPVETTAPTDYAFETEIRDGEYGQILHLTMCVGEKRYLAKSPILIKDDPCSFVIAMCDALDFIKLLMEQDEIG